jgi:uncharacterized membrane protein
MLEFYLISIAGNLSIVACILFFISLIVLIAYVVVYSNYTYNGYNEEEKETTISILKKVLIVFITSCILSIFVPSSKQMMQIYGLGGTIDYLKSNETAKQIPDKCIKALDLYIEKQMTE